MPNKRHFGDFGDSKNAKSGGTVTTKKISDQKFRLKETPKIVKNSWNRWKYGRFYKIHELFREINFTFREKYKKQLREGQT